MHLSTSNSKCAALAYVKVVSLICIAFLIAVEAISVYLQQHHSVQYRRVSQQVAQAIGARPAGPGKPTSVVLIGNSLFLAGVQADRLEELTTSVKIYPIFLEATGYYDWLYALQRIFRYGARPQVVVVQLEANSLLWNKVRPEYSPMFFFDAADVLRVGSDLGLDRTAKSNLLLAHWSLFWSTHSEFRIQILRHTIPHYKELAFIQLFFSLTQTERNTTSGSGFEATLEDRLKTISQLCGAYGAKVIMLAPPTPLPEENIRKLVIVSQRIGVAALAPLNHKELTAAHYQIDGFHLNEKGAALFTSAIARSIGPLLTSPQTAATVDNKCRATEVNSRSC